MATEFSRATSTISMQGSACKEIVCDLELKQLRDGITSNKHPAGIKVIQRTKSLDDSKPI
jgi:hypothetical protein